MTDNNGFFRLDGKVALVTGGGQGIGAAICRRLAQAGARVAVFDLDERKATETATAIGGLGVAGDVTSEADIERALGRVTTWAGTVDILVNNAGIVGKAAPIW